MSCEYEIGASQTTMGRLTDMGVPIPDLAIYNEFSVRSVKGNGQVRGDGFPLAAWQWDTISRAALYRLLEFVGANASATVYIRTRVNRAAGNAASYDDFSAVMVAPDLSGQEGTPSARESGAFHNVGVRFTHLETI